MRRAALGALLVCAAAGGAALALAQGGGDHAERVERSLIEAPRLPRTPSEALVTSGGLTARATPESHCVSDDEGGICVDSVGVGEDSPRLPVASRALVGIRLGATARRVTATLVRIEDGYGGERLSAPLVVRRRGRAARRWSVRLPEALPSEEAALQFVVRYRDYRGEAVRFDVKVRK